MVRQARHSVFEKEAVAAHKAAEAAGEIIARYFGTNLAVEHKSREQPVTRADREANDVIKKILIGAFPADGWLSEETVDTAERLEKQRVWIVDPLDGTKEFIQKIPEFAVSIALSVDGDIVVGVIFNPITKELFEAHKGSALKLNGREALVSSKKELKGATILASRSETKRGEWKGFEETFLVRTSGGIAHKMALVANGAADGSFSLQPKNEWDIAAGTLLVEEGGGKVTRLDGSSFTFNKPNPREKGIVYGNREIHRQLIAMIEKFVR